jgi:hypothetical protein
MRIYVSEAVTSHSSISEQKSHVLAMEMSEEFSANFRIKLLRRSTGEMFYNNVLQWSSHQHPVVYILGATLRNLALLIVEILYFFGKFLLNLALFWRRVLQEMEIHVEVTAHTCLRLHVCGSRY